MKIAMWVVNVDSASIMVYRYRGTAHHDGAENVTKSTPASVSVNFDL